MPEPYSYADDCAEGIVDNVICLTPSHLEQVLGGFGDNGAQAADEDDMLGLELREQNREEVAKRIVEEDVEDKTCYR